MSEHITDRDAVRIALQLAIEWELGLIDAQSCDDVEVAKSERLISAFRRVLRKRYGFDTTPSERLPVGQSVSLTEIQARFEEQRKSE